MGASDGILNELAKEILKRDPLHADFLNGSLRDMPEDESAELADYVRYCVSRGFSLDYLARCYNTIVDDTRNEQFYFLKYGKYRYDRYADVASNVYFDDSYMRKYMYGLALTAFLWPNHAAMHRFFIRTFPRGRHGSYLEVGPGHGYYLRQAVELGDFERAIGIDISPTSVAMTKDIVNHFAAKKPTRIEILEADFLDVSRGDAYSCIVMGEVLEHVEDPGRFLRGLADLGNPESHVFITTCVNAPAVDHIYLFRTTGEIESLIAASGFEVAETCYVPSAGKTLEECVRLALPINTAYVLRKRSC
jgi:2-polyprenyl-3-methyl-5-hydroxy-6-metoxy-1,4-benzoquinol methylase